MTRNPLDIAATLEAAEQTKEKREAQRKQAENDLKSILATVYGRRLMWAMLGDCGVFHGSFQGGDSHADTAFREGRRSIGLMYLAAIQRLAPERYVEMMREANAEPA